MKPVLVLSSSLLTDRMLVHSGFLERLSEERPVVVWATSARNERFRPMWDAAAAEVRPFPDVPPIRERITLARRLNDAAWDLRLRPPSRLSMHKHVRVSEEKRLVRSLRVPARAIAFTHTEDALERLVERLIVARAGSPAVEDALRELDPACVLAMNPFWFRWEPPVSATAKRLGIPVIAFVPSWDNISTKSRPTLHYDAYCVWSERARAELAEFFPSTTRVPVHVVGAPQFDAFRDARFDEARNDFCRRHGLDPSLPIVTYAVGSPNFLQEHHGAAEFARRVARGDLGDAQLLVRPHPIHDRAQLAAQIGVECDHVVVQRVTEPDRELNERSQDPDEVRDWVSTFRHSDVVVNLSSTVTIDAAIFGHPVVNLDFDPAPGAPMQALVHDVNHRWTHFKPVAESGGVWLANSIDEVVEAVRRYLQEPTLHAEQRAWIVRHVCGEVDGHAGERLAQAVSAEASRWDQHSRAVIPS